jgi:hypothetical protein
MKKVLNIILLTLVIIVGSSCDSGFDELNTSKTSATAIDPAFQLNNAVLNLSFPGNALVYEVGIVQHIVTPNSGVLTGANFNQDNRDATQSLWQGYYRNVIRNTRDVIARTSSLPERANLLQMARIVQAYGYMVLTDSYGDIPYTESGKGYLEQELFPVYDDQQTIYNDIIKELSEAVAALGAAGARVESPDIMYGGNVDLWKKFGNSLLLRAGMRLSKVDPAKAQQVVQSAAAGPLILLNSENAAVRHDANYTNPLTVPLNSTEAANYYLPEPFVDYLKNTNDPRLTSIAVRYKGAKSGPEQTATIATRNVADQIGMPLGHNNSTIAGVATSKGLASFYDFSQLDRTRMGKLTAPAFHVTAAQTNLLLAEARHRGWISTSTVADYFSKGIRLHMEQLASYDAAAAVPTSAIDTYIANNPLNDATALQQINTQYWLASFLNAPEAFANFRRSGFPALTPNPFAGKTIKGDFIRRLTYPNSEISVNTQNVNAAISRMGADDLDTRVWWDKP